MEGQPPASAMPSPAGASKPVAAVPAPGAKPTSPRRNNLRHITVVALLGVLALGVSGVIIYFTLHVTGVIGNITQNSSTTLTAEEQAAADVANEYSKLRDRLTIFESDPQAEDETLEADLQNFLGKMINNYGKDSDETINALMLLTEYYNYVGQYDTAKTYLEDRLDVSERDEAKRKYIVELYRLALDNNVTEDAAYYGQQVDEIIGDIDDTEVKSQRLIDLSWDMYLGALEYDEDGDVVPMRQDMLEKVYAMALEAETVHPTAETAILLYYLTRDYGGYIEGASCSDASIYYTLAHERDPKTYPDWSEEESKEEWE